MLGENFTKDVSKLNDIVGILKSYDVEKILIIGPTPRWEIELPKILVRYLPAVPQRSDQYLDNKAININKKHKSSFSNREGVIFIDIMKALCNQMGCLTYFGPNVAETITSFDAGHLTPLTSLFVGKLIKNAVEEHFKLDKIQGATENN